MAKEAQSCCLISLSYKQGTQVYTLGKLSRDSPILWVPSFSTALCTQLNSSFQWPPIPMTPFKPWRWHSSDLQLHWSEFLQNVVTLLTQVWGVSETSGLTLFEPLNLRLQRETTWGSREQTSLPSQTSEFSLLLCPPNLWTEPSGWKFLPWSYCLSYLADYWIMHPAFSLNRNPALLPPHKLME